VANDTILLRTEVRLVELIPKGAGLPFPVEGLARKDCLTVPVTSPKRPVELRVELIAGEGADLMAELGHRERAFAQLKKVLASRNARDGGILNRMGMLAAEIGDAERAVKLYGEAAAAEPSWGGPLFNLALLLQRRGDPAGALEALDGALEREILPPYLCCGRGSPPHSAARRRPRGISPPRSMRLGRRCGCPNGSWAG